MLDRLAPNRHAQLDLMTELGPITAKSDTRDDAGPDMWRRALRDPGREASLLRELIAQGVPVTDNAGEAPRGVAASVEPSAGDPQLVAVIPEGESEPFWVDHRTMRVQQWPRTSLSQEDEIVGAADLADRAQLALGEPVLVRYTRDGGRLCISGVRRLDVRFQFTNHSYRKLSALAAHSGTLAPLSVDAVDRALRLERDFGDEPRVRRIFARAYRRIDEHHTPWAHEGRRATRALSEMARLGRDVMLALADARKFGAALHAGLARFDAAELARLDKTDLVDALRARMALVTSALVLLERGRLATLSLLPALEALCGGGLSRELFDTLAIPQRTAERRALDARLVDIARRCELGAGTLVLPPRDASLKGVWSELKRTLGHVRVLGMDVRPEAIGTDDAHLEHAVREAWDFHREVAEGARRRADLKLAQEAATGSLGPLGIGPVVALAVLMHRLTQAKGEVAEGLAAALLRLRAAALEAGRRLAQEGVLERAEDTLYMPLDEIEQALEGELGAYAARVRLRREDDRRWRNFRAPRFVAGRRA
jgi:hypothetical protein